MGGAFESCSGKQGRWGHLGQAQFGRTRSKRGQSQFKAHNSVRPFENGPGPSRRLAPGRAGAGAPRPHPAAASFIEATWASAAHGLRPPETAKQPGARASSPRMMSDRHDATHYVLSSIRAVSICRDRRIFRTSPGQSPRCSIRCLSNGSRPEGVVPAVQGGECRAAHHDWTSHGALWPPLSQAPERN